MIYTEYKYCKTETCNKVLNLLFKIQDHILVIGFIKKIGCTPLAFTIDPGPLLNILWLVLIRARYFWKHTLTRTRLELDKLTKYSDSA